MISRVLRRVDPHARPHGAGQRDRVDVAALGRCRLRADDLLDDGGVVLEQRALVEALAADREVDVGAAVGAVLELARLGLAHGLPHVHRDRARLRVRHLPARAEDPAELADRAHHVRRGDGDVEVVEAFFDLRGEIGGADDVGACLLSLARLLALGEHGDPDVLARPVGEHERPAELLVGVADVEAEVEVHLDRLVELRGGRVLQEPDGLERRVRVLAVDLLARLVVALPVLRHYLATSTPIDRAVPSMMRIA